MNLIIRNGPVPIYEQIYQQIKQQIMDGSLMPNQELPSIRALAKELNISVITIKKAYELLNNNDLTYSVPGKGNYVAEIDIAFQKKEVVQYIEEQLTELEQLAQTHDLSLQDIFTRRNQND
ncbi:GntR family transcriptional regulator [Vagococcus silagei]|uniref:GntR family transcriptional regulator n=1 Tax=Vagococcus silagei TaxID=2508885 RepID=A0A4S3B282_9ENTE|nr:GntR family transcriptional regulator [Vagococcus silagei]THB61161.1 GntR family transcriptional regulator [Vagococcus silagei]